MFHASLKKRVTHASHSFLAWLSLFLFCIGLASCGGDNRGLRTGPNWRSPLVLSLIRGKKMYRSWKLFSVGRLPRALLACMLAAFFVSQPARSQTYDIKDLGTLGTGLDSYAYDINNRGQIVGGSATLPRPICPHCFNRAPFLYDKGVMTELGTQGGEAMAINDSGQVVGYFHLGGALDHRSAFLYDNGVVTDIGTLPGYRYSEAFGINNRGQIVGAAQNRAFLFQNGVMSDLGTLPGGGGAGATGINNHGTVVGDSGTNVPNLTTHAFSYDHRVMSDLGTLPGGSYSYGLAINSGGQIVGYGDTASGAQHALLFRNGHMIDLGTLPGGTFSTATAINDRGQVVGYGDTPSKTYHAFLYEKGAMVDLGMLPGGDSSVAYGINNRGDVVGSVGFPNGHDRATLWSRINPGPDDQGSNDQGSDDNEQ